MLFIAKTVLSRDFLSWVWNSHALYDFSVMQGKWYHYKFYALCVLIFHFYFWIFVNKKSEWCLGERVVSACRSVNVQTATIFLRSKAYETNLVVKLSKNTKLLVLIATFSFKSLFFMVVIVRKRFSFSSLFYILEAKKRVSMKIILLGRVSSGKKKEGNRSNSSWEIWSPSLKIIVVQK